MRVHLEGFQVWLTYWASTFTIFIGKHGYQYDVRTGPLGNLALRVIIRKYNAIEQLFCNRDIHDMQVLWIHTNLTNLCKQHGSVIVPVF